MPQVIAQPHLQNAGFRLTSDAAAIDKPLRDMTDFGDVEVRRNLIAIRQGETWQGIGMACKGGAEFLQFHVSVYILL